MIELLKEAIKKSVAKVGYQNIVLDENEKTIFLKNEGIKLGLGGIGQGYIAKKIENDFGMPLQEIITAARTSTMQTINSEFSKGIKMKGDVLAIEPKDIKVTENGIVALVNAKAKVELIVKGL